jgi:hypothetical protein
VNALDSADVERLLLAAFDDARSTVAEHPDLFARVEWSIEAAAERRRFRFRIAGGVAAVVVALASFALALSDYRDGRIVMAWWVLELIANIVLVLIAIALGPFIKRFGRAYAADVFSSNPGTGKSYLVLTDVAYYLIFVAYILLTMRFEQANNWVDSRPEQVQHEIARVGGILLLMGALHTANVVALPVIANLLEAVRQRREPPPDAGFPSISAGLGSGSWVLRIEPAGGDAVPPSAAPSAPRPPES